MPYIKKINIPGIDGLFEFEPKRFSDSLNSEIVDFIKRHVIFEMSSTAEGTRKKIIDQDTSYLEKASIEGSEENNFFNEYVAPILEEIGKETDPKEILEFIQNQKERGIVPVPGTRNIDELSKFILMPNTRYSDIETIYPDLESINDLADYLKNQGAIYNNFSGANSIVGAKRSDISNAVESIESVIEDNEDDLDMVKDLRSKIDNIFRLHSSGDQKNVFPLAMTVKGLKDFEGDDIPDFQYYFPVRIPVYEDYINIERTANLELEDGSSVSVILDPNAREGNLKAGRYYTDENGVRKKIVSSDIEEEINIDEEGFRQNFIKDYLKSYKVSDYIDFRSSTSKYSEDKDLTELSLILQLIEAQKEQGINVQRDIKPLLDFRKKYTKNIRGGNNALQTANKRVTDKFSRLASVSNKRFPNVNDYLKELIDKYDNREREPRGNKANLPIEIPYRYFEQKSDFKKKVKKGDKQSVLNSLFDEFEESWNSNKKNPLSGRNPIETYISFFDKSEEDDSLYLDSRLYDIIDSGDAEALKRYYVYNNIQGLKNEEFTLEHVTPVSYLNQILWDQIYVPMKEAGKNDEEIKKALEYTIKTLYKEALILSKEDNAKLKDKLRSHSPLTSSDFKSLRNMNADENLAFKRYERALVPIPEKMSKWRQNFPKHMKDITYGQIYKTIAENQNRITNLLFGYYG